MLKLEVGKTYLDKLGREITITSYLDENNFPFYSGSTRTYYLEDGTSFDELDLVSEVVKSIPTVPAHTDGPKMTVRSLINGTIVIYLDKDCDPDLLITFAKGLKDV